MSDGPASLPFGPGPCHGDSLRPLLTATPEKPLVLERDEHRGFRRLFPDNRLCVMPECHDVGEPIGVVLSDPIPGLVAGLEEAQAADKIAIAASIANRLIP